MFDRTAPELWRVAAHLCRDRHAAEDAVQGTFLSAIETKGEWDGERPLLPWLLGLLANRVRENRRRAARVPDPARVALSCERDPVEVASAGELGSAFAATLLRLGEPYRTAIELHLVHGRAPHEIAMELGVPAGTVRMRLHRGLEQLRRKLPQGFVTGGAVVLHVPPESFAAMREVVLAKAGGSAVAVASSGHAVAGTIGALLPMKTALSVLAACVTVFSLWIAWPVMGGASVAPEEIAAANVSTAERPMANAMATEPGPNELAVPSGQRVAAQGAPGDRGQLRVVLRNAGNGKPVAGLVLYVMGGLLESTALDLSKGPMSATADSSRVGRTDENGMAIFDLPVGFARVTARQLSAKPWHAAVAAGSETELVVDVPVALAVDIHVVDGSGRSVPDARILGCTEIDALGLVERELGRAGADGHWRQPFVESSITVRAVAPGHSASPEAVLGGDKGTATLQLGAAPAVLEGAVRAVDGVPIAETGVVIQPAAWSKEARPLIVRTDAQGRYECAYVPPGRCLVLAWRKVENGQRRFTQVAAEAVGNVHTVVDVQFGRGARFVASLRGPHGPLGHQRVALALQHRGLPFCLTAVAANYCDTDAQGNCTIDGIMPGQYELQVPAEDDLFREFIDLAEGQEYRFERTFGGDSWIELHVVDEAGAPLAGWFAVLRPKDEGTPRPATIDREGRARFEALPAGTYKVTLHEAEGLLASVTREIPTGVRTDVVVTKAAMPTGRVRGALFAGQVVAFDKMHVLLWRGRFEPGSRPEQVEAKVDAKTGAFETKPVPAGTYLVSVMEDLHHIVALRTHIEVRAEAVVELGRIEVGTGTAVFLVTRDDGSPVHGAFVAVTIADLHPFSRWQWQTQANGIELKDLPPTTLDILVWGPDIAPVLTQLTARIGGAETVPVVAARGTPTTVQFAGTEDRGNLAIVTIRKAGGVLLTEIIDRAVPYVRGFAPGSYRIEFDAFDGLRGAADFTVGTTLGAPIEVALRR